jgi:hypothetical protein
MTDLSQPMTALAHLLGASAQPQVVPNTPYSHLETFTIVRANATIDVSARRGSKGAFLGAQFTIVLPAKVTMADVLLREERTLDRIGSALRVNREFQSGDPGFDHRVYIESDAPDITLRRLLSPSVRDLVLRTVTLGGLHVSLSEPLLGPGAPLPTREARDAQPTHVSVFAPASSLTNASAMQAVPELLVAIARAITVAHEEGLASGARRDPYGRVGAPIDLEAERPPPARVARGIAAASLVVANWILAATMQSPPTLGPSPTIIGVIAGIVLALVELALFGLLLRGRSTSLRNVIICAVVMFGAPLVTGVRVAKKLNATLAPEQSHTSVGFAVMRSGSKGARWVELSVDNTRVSLPSSEAVRLHVTLMGANVSVVVREGALGSDWVERVEPLGPSPLF